MQKAATRQFLAAANADWSPRDGVPMKGRVIAHLREPETGDHVACADLPHEIDLLEMPRGKPPLFVSYFTENTPYEALAARLRASLDRLGLPHRIEGIPSRGSWVANTGLKAGFIERVWQGSDGPICWIDADAEMLRVPHVVFDNPFDFAIVRRHGWYDISSFVYLGKSDAAGRLVSDWARICREHPNVWDQVLLTLAWHRTARDTAMASLWLNDGIFRFPRPRVRDLRDQFLYYPFKRKIRPFVDQKQASRNLKSFIDASKKRPDEFGSDDVAAAFRQALVQYDFGFDARIETIFDTRAPGTRSSPGIGA